MRRAINEMLSWVPAMLLVMAPLCAADGQSQAQQQAASQAAGGQSAQTQQQGTPALVPAPSAPRQSAAAKQRRSVPLRSTSDLVRIDVEVTDHSGKPIKGLKPEQFVVTDNGKSQNVTFFTYEDIEAIDTAGAANSEAKPIVVPIDSPTPIPEETITNQVRDRRMLVLFFDLTSMGDDDMLRARDGAKKFIEKQMSPADLVAVVVYSSKLSVWADFTNDRAKLQKAIDHLTPGVSADLASGLYAAAQEGEYDVQGYTGAAYTPDETEFNVFNTDQKLAAVEGLANVLADIPGRKAIIEFTSGVTQTGEENRTELRAATDAANRADVSIYSIDARGLYTAPPGGDATTDSATGTSLFSGAAVFHQTDQRQDSRDTLATLSTDTGGKTFFDLGDLSDAFPKIQQDNTGYYLIGYYLGSNVKHDGSWRSVHVKVTVPGAHVRFRNGYYAPRDFQHLERADRDQQLADAIHSEDPIVELPIAVETAIFRLSGGQAYVPIDAKLSATALDWAEKHGKREAEFDFAAEVRAGSSQFAVAQLRDTITVNLDPERYQQISQANLQYQGGVVLAPGTYHLKFVARENESGKIGTFEQDIVVPPASPEKLALSSVLLSSQIVPAAKSPEVQTKTEGLKARLTASPLDVNGETIVPSVTRYFTQQQTLYIFFQAYYPEKGASFDPNTLRAGLIFFRKGLQINATPLLAPTEINASAHTASFRISLPLSKLPTGRYAIQAVVIGAGTDQAAFGRSYLALQQATPAPNAAAPATTPPTPQNPPRP
ncbi:MAG TPA: VWA domain-containing protein [Candidatus Limnocylindrales bacterium]|nr:VWA domain-containing protein [Candidatus Limnocylindrales bacterium]